ALEPDAGAAAGFPDAAYQAVRVQPDVVATADIVLKVAPPTAQETSRIKEGAILIGLLAPYANADGLTKLAARNVSAFAMERMPRIPRVQSVVALSATTTVAGYRAALFAAPHLPRFFPLLMTAAGTITPAKVLIVGAGVAGLQAIATCRRLGAEVWAYDTRPVVREQVESLGAKFVDLGLDTAGAEGTGGHAQAPTQAVY